MSLANGYFKNFLYLARLWSLFSKQRKRQVIFAFSLMFLSSLADFLSLSSALPFLFITISDKEKLTEIPILDYISNILSLKNTDQLVIICSLLFATTILLSFLIRTINLKYTQRLSATLGTDLSSKAYFNSLSQSYDFHIKTNSSELIARITNFSDRTVVVITQTLYFFSSILTSLGLFGAFLLVNWKISLCSTLLLFLIYLFIIKF